MFGTFRTAMDTSKLVWLKGSKVYVLLEAAAGCTIATSRGLRIGRRTCRRPTGRTGRNRDAQLQTYVPEQTCRLEIFDTGRGCLLLSETTGKTAESLTGVPWQGFVYTESQPTGACSVAAGGMMMCPMSGTSYTAVTGNTTFNVPNRPEP